MRTLARWVIFFVMTVNLIFLANGAIAQDYPSEHQDRIRALSAATAATQSSTDSNGFTHWRAEINSGCRSSDHSYTLDINAKPQNLSDISYTMSNQDVDYNDAQGCRGGPEVDRMSFNGHALGTLQGANNSWSINSWPLTQSQVVEGSNRVFIDTDAPGTGCWCVGVGYIEVIAKVGFAVQSYTPGKDEKSRAFTRSDLGLSVTFSDSYDPKALTGSTFLLEYRNQAGAWQSVSGTFAQTAPETFRFEPGADLKDGVKYRATIKGGSGGVKSLAGGQLARDEQWSFWTVPNLGLTDSFGGGICPPSADPCPGLEVAVFQVSRNAPLVVGKAAVARTFARWKKHADVYDADLVKELEADFELKSDGVTQTLRNKVKRPDLYSAADRIAALESVNIYGAPTSSAQYSVKVKPTPQSNAKSVEFDSNKLTLGKTKSAPSFTLNYYFLHDGDWAAGAPAAARTDGRKVMTNGATFIGDNFPLLRATVSELGELRAGYTNTGKRVDEGVCVNVREVSCPGMATPMSERQCVFRRLNQLVGSNPFVAALVPASLCPESNGTKNGKAFIYYQGGTGVGGYSTIAHELGHIYTLADSNNPSDDADVEGFQVRLKRNRSFTADNAGIASLMHQGQAADRRWIKRADYGTLQTTVAGGIAAASARASGVLNGMSAPSATGYLIVDGVVDLSAGTASLGAAYVQSDAQDAPEPGGVCRIDLRNAGGTVVASFAFNPQVLQEESSGQAGTAAAAGPQLFSASVPWNDAAAEMQLLCNGTLLASRSRTAIAPQVAFVGLSNGATLTGIADIRWLGTDADGPGLSYQLAFSADNGASWTKLTPIVEDSQFQLDTTRLPSTQSGLLSVMVTDGFNTDYATVQVTVSNALAIQGTIPSRGETDVDVNTPVTVFFVSPVDEATLSPASFRVTAGGQAVSGSLTYDAGGKTATFTPASPLAHATVHTVALTSALRDQAGNALIPISWTFTTAADRGAPTVVSVFPAGGDSAVPLNALVQVGFSEPVDPATLSSASLLLLDANGASVPGQAILLADRQAAIFAADANLAAESDYRVVVTTVVKDTQGNALEGNFESEFRTGDAPFNVLRVVGDYRDNAVDEDGDGLYDKLVISVAVEVAQSGSYNLNGRLTTGDRDPIQWSTSGTVYLAYGIHRLNLVFDAEPIRNSGVDGPYVLDALNFYLASNPSIGDVVFNAFRTFPYTVSKFYSAMTLGPLPDQLLRVGTARDNAIDLRALTTHRTEPVDSVSYSLLVNPVPQAGVSIDSGNHMDINPWPGTQSESDVTVEARDRFGNKVQSTFHVSVQAPVPGNLVLRYAAEMPLTSEQEIHVDIYDQFGTRFEEPTTAYFETTLGSIWPESVETAFGSASATLSSGTEAGSAFVTVTAGDAETVAAIEFTGPVDSDGDGVRDDADRCPTSDLKAKLAIGRCDCGIANTRMTDGCSVADVVRPIAEVATKTNLTATLGDLQRLAFGLKAKGILSAKDVQTLVSCMQASVLGRCSSSVK